MTVQPSSCSGGIRSTYYTGQLVKRCNHTAQSCSVDSLFGPDNDQTSCWAVSESSGITALCTRSSSRCALLNSDTPAHGGQGMLNCFALE